MATNNALNNNLANCTGLVASSGINAGGTPSAATLLAGNDQWIANPSVQVKITLTAAQVAGSNASPVLVIPAVTGKTIIITSVSILYNFNASMTGFANTWQFVYTGTSLILASQAATSASAAALWIFAGNAGNAGVLTPASAVGVGVSFKTNSAVTGGGTGTFDFTINYYTI